MPDQLSPRNNSTFAVITGGTQGLGLAIARRLAREGAPGIVITGRNRDRGAGAAKEVQALGTQCLLGHSHTARPAQFAIRVHD